MIDIPELGDERHRLWCDLVDLAAEHPHGWTIIGAHMVALYAWEAGLSSRPSDDVDVLVNVRLVSDGTELVSRFLLQRDYELEVTDAEVAHLFRRGVGQVDVLAPDGLGARANLKTVSPHRTLRVPGGTQALNRSVPVEIRTRQVEGEVPRPDLLGAILVKVRAIGVDDLPDAQRGDVALLLALVDDPDRLRRELSRTERGWLRRHGYFGDPSDERWDSFPADDPERVAIVYRRLLG
jgi:hypothetical protein